MCGCHNGVHFAGLKLCQSSRMYKSYRPSSAVRRVFGIFESCIYMWTMCDPTGRGLGQEVPPPQRQTPYRTKGIHRPPSV